MLRVYACITEAHDLRLVLLAAVICVFASFAAFNLVGRANPHARFSLVTWLSAAAVVAGSGIWATHFVAMLAFRPGFPVGYDIGLTMLSIVVAIVLSGAGFFVGVRYRRRLLAGVVLGVAIGTMHYIGMAALIAPATMSWDTTYIVASLGIGVVFGMAACEVGLGRSSWRSRLGATGLLALAICGMHFTAMTALTLELDLAVPATEFVMAPHLLAIAVTAVSILIVALGFAGAVFDQHLAGRAAQEADRLRAHVAELEATKRELAARTEEATAALEKAAAASKAKSQFLAAMSHELRTPLNAIIGFAEVQIAQTFGPLGDPRYRVYAQDIRNSGRHLLGLINDVLDFTKLDAGKLALHEEPVDLAALIATAIQMTERQAEKAKVRIEVDVEGELPPVRGDLRRLRQVLLNLLSNAVKFTPEHGVVTITAAPKDGGLAIAVTDTGIGMAREDIDTALDVFGQIDSRLSRRFEGTGLGLPLSKRLVELHDGALEIDSSVGDGTTVTVTLPESRLATESIAA